MRISELNKRLSIKSPRDLLEIRKNAEVQIILLFVFLRHWFLYELIIRFIFTALNQFDKKGFTFVINLVPKIHS